MLISDYQIEVRERKAQRATGTGNGKNVFVRTDRTTTATNQTMKKSNSKKTIELLHRREAPLETPTDLTHSSTRDIAAAMNAILADVFALYLKTKNFHWHMSGSHFRDYHLLLDEQAGQLFAMTDDIAERARKIGGTTLRSIGDIARHQRLKDNNAESVAAGDMLRELCSDNQELTRILRQAHEACDRHNDVATA